MRKFLAAVVIALSSCSSPDLTHSISATYVHELRIRRPPGVPATPGAEPGGSDYLREPLPNEAYDCEMPETLLNAIDVRAVWTCVVNTQVAVEKSIGQDESKSGPKPASEVEYEIVLSPQPELVLDPDAKIACFRSALPKIPVPREIVFQAEPHENSCYASRLNVEANEVMGLTLPGKKTFLKIKFPLENPPRTEAEMRRILLSWALAPVMDRERPGSFRSSIVPDSICKKCMAKKKLYDPARDHPPTMWPALGPTLSPAGEAKKPQ